MYRVKRFLKVLNVECTIRPIMDAQFAHIQYRVPIYNTLCTHTKQCANIQYNVPIYNTKCQSWWMWGLCRVWRAKIENGYDTPHRDKHLAIIFMSPWMLSHLGTYFLFLYLCILACIMYSAEMWWTHDKNENFTLVHVNICQLILCWSSWFLQDCKSLCHSK